MKRIFFLIFSLCLSVYSFSQEQQTKTYALLSTPDKLLYQELYLIDKLPARNYTVRVEAIIIDDINAKVKNAALRLTSYSTVGTELSTHTALLDADEIEPLIKSLEHFKNNVLNTKPVVYSEIEFRSRSNIRVGAYYEPRNKAWNLYFNPKGSDAVSKAIIQNDKIDEAINVFQIAWKHVKEKTR